MENYLWTKHSEYKLQQYALSKQRVRRVMRHPDRTEKSIVPGMVACMQIAGTSKNRQEIWVMYEVKKVTSDKRQATSESQEEEERMLNVSSHPSVSVTRHLPSGRGGGQIQNARNSSNFPPPTSNFKNLSPAQRFRLERQQAFAARSGTLGGNGKTLRVISVWRYPGTSPERDPIPAEILEEIRDIVR